MLQDVFEGLSGASCLQFIGPFYIPSRSPSKWVGGWEGEAVGKEIEVGDGIKPC